MRAEYQAKRRSIAWKNSKKQKLEFTKIQKIKERKQSRKPFHPYFAPNNFSLINNTDSVLSYFEEVKKGLKSGKNVTLDISKVDTLTPDTVALMVACINDADFTAGSKIRGNAPEKLELLKLFTQSGFYDHVQTNKKFSKGEESLLHKETHQKVEPLVVKDALLRGKRHVFGDEDQDLGLMYDILVECMSNTNSHADLQGEGTCFWWLYVYNDPNRRVTTYTFLDLGVGIFKSATVEGLIKKITKGTMLYPNIKLVDDLLSGKIKSRAKADREIRGKGVPQIVDNAQASYFGSFYIIANDVKINVKTKERQQLEHSLDGTMLYWEICNSEDYANR